MIDKFFQSLQQVPESLLNIGSQIRYGVSPTEKDEIMYRGDFPGAVKYSQDPAGAERATSGYLAGKQWGSAGPFMTDVFNRIRQSVVDERPELRDIAVDAATQGMRTRNLPDFFQRS